MIIKEKSTIIIEKEAEETISITCDFCGEEMDECFKQTHGEGTVSIGFGYGSIFDDSTFHLQICDDCFLKNFGRMVVKQMEDKGWNIDVINKKIEEVENK